MMDPAGYDYYEAIYSAWQAQTSSPPIAMAESCRVVGCWFNTDVAVAGTGGIGTEFEIKYLFDATIFSSGLHLHLPEGLAQDTGHFSNVIDGIDAVIPQGGRLYMTADGLQIAAANASITWVTEPF